MTAYDQDTQISDRLVSILAADLQKLIESGERVAGIGSLIIDDCINNTLSFVLFRFPFNARYSGKARAKEDCVVECSFLISSGCLMSMKAVEEIGAMNKSLFIDNVDVDWRFRAADKRYKVYGNFAGVIRQRMGENCTQIPFTNSVIRHHDFNRNFYMTRNRFWLYRQAYVNGPWVLHDVCRFAKNLLYLLVFKEGHITLLKSSAKGILDSFAVKPYEKSSS